MSTRRFRAVLSAVTVFAVVTGGLAATIPAAAAEPDLARQGTITASASQDDQDGTYPAENAIDGDDTTRWASGNGPDADEPFTASLTVDLGAVASVTGVTIEWEAAYAAGYDVQVATSDPGVEASWSTAYSETASDGSTDEVVFDEPTEARYVRLAMLQRVAFDWEPGVLHYYGYSVFTFGVQGELAEPAVGFVDSTVTVNAGEDAALEVELNSPSDAARSVHVATVTGTAVPGQDYTSVEETLEFGPGETSATVAIPTFAMGGLAPVVNFRVDLSDPSDGIVLGSKASALVTVLPTGDIPNFGGTQLLESFEEGVPADYSTWAIRDDVKPVLEVVADATAPEGGDDNHVLHATVGGSPVEGDWFGFTNDRPAEDWSDFDGFSFWFLGTGSGKSLSYELKNGNTLFDRTVVDDTTGWRQLSVLFSDLRVKGNPSSPVRFDPSAATGFAVTLSGLGAGEWTFDDFGIFERAVTLQDFEGDVPIGSSADPVGFFTWGSQPDLVTLGVGQLERGDNPDNHVLSGDYLIPSGGYGGFSDNLAVAQDWSGFRGIRFWWYASQASNPASPTAGDDIKVEIKDGGPDGEHSELWAATFKDNWGSSTSRWKLVELPFSQFTLGGYQPGSAETQNGTLDLTHSWGFAPTFTPGKATTTGWAIDDVQLYGTPSEAASVTVGTTEDVYLVDQGDTATVGVTVETTTGEPLATDVTVDWATGDGSAVPGTNYTEGSGTLTFPAGTESGAVQDVEVATIAVSGGDEARSIPITLTSLGAALPAADPLVVINAHGLPYLDESLGIEYRVDDLLARMSLAEKVGQMAQAERLGLASPGQIADLGLGSVLSGGGSVPAENTPEGWADMIDDYQRQALSTALQVPLLYGADAVHGHSNVVDATIFPHNIGLGATRDPALVEEVAEVTAEETKSTGVNWAFAPCLCVSRDERWGRTYESFGEDPALVKTFAEGAIVGLQGEDPTDKTGSDELLATAKHWAGDGGTAYDPSKVGTGYPIDQGLTTADSLEDFVQLHVDPYLPALDAGVGSIMPSYSGVDLGDGNGDVRMHENELLNTELLKGDLGFGGFLISDWEGIDKLPGGTYADKVVRSVNSGLDMAMAPYNFGAFITSVTDAVGSGAIEQSRVDDAVRRILTQKFELGLFEQPFADRSLQGEVGGAENRAVARESVADSQVLLKNDDVLPLAKDASIYLAGSNADDIGNQSGGWTISWQGSSGDITSGTTIREGLAEVAPDAEVTFSEDASAPLAGHDVGVVVVGETPYAEGQGDVGNNGKSLSLSAADRATIDTVCGELDCVVLVVAGRTQLVTDRIDEIDGLVASFLPGTEGAGVADTLFGDVPFTGRLPLTWPATAEQVPINVGDADYEPLFAYGWGERTDAARDRVLEIRAALPAGSARSAIDALLAAKVWGGAGEVSKPAAAFPLIAKAAKLVTGENADLLVSVARDLAQDAFTGGTAADGAAAITADAEHALLTGHAYTAVKLLASVLGLSVDLKSQTISFGSLKDKTLGDPDFTVKATASSGLKVTFTARGACTVKNGRVHLVSAGVCSITAAQPGNEQYAAAQSVTRSFDVRTPVLDDFGRRDGAVGGHWTGATSTRSFAIDGRKLNVGRGGALVWKVGLGTSQEASVTLARVDRDSRVQGLLLKTQSGSLDRAGAISVVYDAKSKAVRVAAYRGGSRDWTEYSGKRVTFSSGDVLTARVTADGIVRVYRDGALVKTVTLDRADAKYFADRGGRAGILTAKASGAVLDTFRAATWRE